MASTVGLRWPSKKLSRTPISVTSSSLSTNATDSSKTINLGKSGAIFTITTDIPAWVRLYSKALYRSSDLSRDITTDPSGEHGVLLDVLTSLDKLSIDLSPVVLFSDLEDSPIGELAIAITNKSGSTDTVTVTLHRVANEG